MDLKILKEVVDSALENVELKGDYPYVNISKTDFGTSYYIENQNHKIRISDHSVTRIDRIFEENHFSLNNLNLDSLKKTILELFSKEYKTLIISNGDKLINFHKQVHITDFKNWKVAKVWFQEVQYLPIKIEEIKNNLYKIKNPNYTIIEEKEITKKGDKKYCKILVDKYSFGVKNIKTNEIIRTRFPLSTPYEIEIKLENEKKTKKIKF